MTRSPTLKERVEAQVTTGRPHSFDRDFGPLVDTPVRPGLTPRERVVVLARLSCVKEALQQLAFEASDLGLVASRLRLGLIADDVDDAIAKAQHAIQDAR